MKKNTIIIPACLLALAGACLCSCSDDDMFTKDGQQAYIVDDPAGVLSVIGRSGNLWKSRMSNDTIYIKVSPQYDVTEELDSVFPKFFVSKGATVSPDPNLPQDFSVEGGVKYTVTSEDGKAQRSYVVTHGLTDFIAYGGGVSLGAEQLEKKFTELGYPGEFENWSPADSRLYGDLNAYVAFCSPDYVVILGRQYSDPQFSSLEASPDFKLGLRIFDAETMNEAAVSLNTGSINIQNIRAISSDSKAHLVAGVYESATSGSIYYWTEPTAQPVKLATIDQAIFPSVDGSNYIQVSGDITGKCNIFANMQRNTDGTHYYMHCEGGAVTDQKSINTGYRSDDGCGFQNISAFGDEPEPDYVIADTEGSGNNSVRVYVNTFSGKTKTIMPNVLQNDFHQWWVGTGGALSRTGGRRPYVSGMTLNGKNYAMILNGTAWWYCNTIVDADDLHARVSGAEKDFSINAAWSFGATGDWYWDDSTHTGYWIGWADRYGFYKYKITCYEM